MLVVVVLLWLLEATRVGGSPDDNGGLCSTLSLAWCSISMATWGESDTGTLGLGSGVGGKGRAAGCGGG